jgi:tetratricopeptide (TPR) repeat protein
VINVKNNRLCYCGSGKLYEKCCVFLDEINMEYNHITPYDDSNIENYSLDVEMYELTEAEDLFKKLTRHQPHHHDGFRGLAKVYEKKGERDKMIYFYDQAIKKAKDFLKDDSIDPEMIKIIESEKYAAIKS